MKKLTFWNFIRSNKSHTVNLAIYTALSLLIGSSILLTKETFSPEWSRYVLSVFIFGMGALSWYRVYLIWKRLK